jgi:hypothetical protein
MMNDILFSLRKVLLTVTLVLLVIVMLTVSKLQNVYNFIILLTFITLFGLLVMELLKKKQFYNDILYNGAYVSSMIYILIVIIRSICDSYIITSNNALAGKYAEGYRMVFFNNNSIIILIIVIGLLIYSILMMIGEGKNDRHKHIKK